MKTYRLEGNRIRIGSRLKGVAYWETTYFNIEGVFSTPSIWWQTRFRCADEYQHLYLSNKP
jgi:hypothetical protein